MTISERLKAERVRLGLNQVKFGELAGVTKQTVIQWEKGAQSPNAVHMQALASQGADVLFIILGQISPLALARDEVELIETYRGSSPDVRAILKGAVVTAADMARNKSSTQNFHGSVGQVISGDQNNQAPLTFNLGDAKEK